MDGSTPSGQSQGGMVVTEDWRWLFRARLERVVDGDTARFTVDCGFHVQYEVSIRVKDLNAPELFSGIPEERERGAAAKERTWEWLTDHLHRSDAPDRELLVGRGWPFLLRTEKDHQSFNRFIADVSCCEGHDLATSLIADYPELFRWSFSVPQEERRRTP
jgi:hypothetical protein